MMALGLEFVLKEGLALHPRGLTYPLRLGAGGALAQCNEESSQEKT